MLDFFLKKFHTQRFGIFNIRFNIFCMIGWPCTYGDKSLKFNSNVFKRGLVLLIFI